MLLMPSNDRSDSMEFVQAHLGDGAGSVPDHSNTASLATKRVIIFLLVEVLAFNL